METAALAEAPGRGELATRAAPVSEDEASGGVDGSAPRVSSLDVYRKAAKGKPAKFTGVPAGLDARTGPRERTSAEPDARGKVPPDARIPQLKIRRGRTQPERHCEYCAKYDKDNSPPAESVVHFLVECKHKAMLRMECFEKSNIGVEVLFTEPVGVLRFLNREGGSIFLNRPAPQRRPHEQQQQQPRGRPRGRRYPAADPAADPTPRDELITGPGRLELLPYNFAIRRAWSPGRPIWPSGPTLSVTRPALVRTWMMWEAAPLSDPGRPSRPILTRNGHPPGAHRTWQSCEHCFTVRPPSPGPVTRQLQRSSLACL